MAVGDRRSDRGVHRRPAHAEQRRHGVPGQHPRPEPRPADGRSGTLPYDHGITSTVIPQLGRRTRADGNATEGIPTGGRDATGVRPDGRGPWWRRRSPSKAARRPANQIEVHSDMAGGVLDDGNPPGGGLNPSVLRTTGYPVTPPPPVFSGVLSLPGSRSTWGGALSWDRWHYGTHRFLKRAKFRSSNAIERRSYRIVIHRLRSIHRRDRNRRAALRPQMSKLGSEPHDIGLLARR